MLRSNLYLPFALLAFGLLLPAPLTAAVPRVDDRAEFFSKSAREQATRTIRENLSPLQGRGCDRDVSLDPGQFAESIRGRQDEFLSSLGEERAADEGVKGIYLLICKDPRHVTVEPDDSLRVRGFTQGESEELATKMAGDFEEAERPGPDGGRRFHGKQTPTKSWSPSRSGPPVRRAPPLRATTRARGRRSSPAAWDLDWRA